MSRYELAARRGAELLDSRPEAAGWRERINPDTLNLASSCGCVLGQTFGWFEDGLDALHIDYDEATKYGFSIELEPFADHRSLASSYGWLTRAWRKVLRNGD